MSYVPPFSLTDEMLEIISEISENLGSIRNVEELSKLPRLRRIGRLKSIQSSLAIENNSLSIDQVSDVIEGKRVLGPPNEIQEVKNAFAAYAELENLESYDIDDLLRIHGIMTAGLVEESEMFRTVNEGVYSSDGKAVHVAPPPYRVPELMIDLFDWLKNSKAHALIKSSVFHYELEFIHPFRDGNGRIGRIWQTAILMSWKPIFAWIPVESVIHERQSEYYEAIASSTAAGSSNAFILFMLTAIKDSLNTTASETRVHINHMNGRMRKLLSVLETYPLSSVELMERLGLKSRDTFRNNYLNPAIEAGLVSLTEPNNPRSRDQGYFKK